MPLKLNVIVASTRPGRKGPALGEWFRDYARAKSNFDVDLVDLADFELPVYDEAKHPRMQDYQHEHTRRWSESVASADAYVFVTPEYNFGPPPSLTNALTYVYSEWGYKPASFVSYGGVSGGIRAVQSAKLALTTLKVVPIMETVTVPFFTECLEGDRFSPKEIHEESADALLKELHRWAAALKTMRESEAAERKAA